MTNQNTAIWDQVYKTDPAHTKQATVSGQKITSISGMAMIMRATEVFGPVGTGWGWEVAEERFDKGGPIFDESKDKDGKVSREVIGYETGHTIKIRLWYMQDGEQKEIYQYGCTPFMYRSKWGITTDTEAPKKSLTDAIKKALSMLGFSADIFLGMFDDRDYLQSRHEEAAIEAAEDKAAEIERQREERLEWLKGVIEAMDTAQSKYELDKLHTSAVRSASTRKETQFVTRLARAHEENVKRLAEGKA